MTIPTTKKARLCADVISKSFNLDLKESRKLIAQVFNFNSWDHFIESTQNVKDRTLSESEVYTLNEIFSHRLCQILDIPISRNLLELIKKMSPYSKKPAPYRFDLNSIQGSSDTLISFDDIHEQMGMMHESGNGDEAMMDSLKDLVKQFGGDESGELLSVLENTNFGQLQNMMREAHPVNEELVCNALTKFLNVEFDYIDEPDNMCVAEYYDEHGEPNPLFLTSMVAMPGDSNDTTYLDMVKRIENVCDMNFEKPMILNGSVAFKEIDDKTYAVVGLWHDGHNWNWIFLGNGVTPWQQKRLLSTAQLDNLENSLDNIPPPVELSVPIDDGYPIHLIWHCIVKPSEKPTHQGDSLGVKVENRYIVSGVTGWKTFV
ncbi:hypothetical protein [Aliivibrio fischeri]|uniref:hypothetical protein n=1 Tax=Aliivibrio fischeri TaxID=668 RepID=UPI0007C491D1|nr:hypothetical protein [Aliivibrio fischeri]